MATRDDDDPFNLKNYLLKTDNDDMYHGDTPLLGGGVFFSLARERVLFFYYFFINIFIVRLIQMYL